MSKLKIYTFDDLVFTPHTVIPGARKAYLELPNETNVSVVGGGSGLYGDGETTFEVWYSDEEDPRGWQSIKSINREFGERSIRLLSLL
jgi:hypothetical protein